LAIVGTKMMAWPAQTAALKVELKQNLEALQKASEVQTKQLGTANAVQKRTKTRLDKLQAENESLGDQVETLKELVSDLQKAIDGQDVKTDTRQNMQDEAPGLDADTETPINKPTKNKPTSPAIKTEQQSALAVLIDTFPRAKMLAAVKAQETSKANKPGWLRRALSKHIKVRDGEAVDPYMEIAAAEAALKGGDIPAALAHIKKLNPPVRTSAAEWVQAAKKVVKKSGKKTAPQQ
ncbi:MAG: hypothetical protein L3J05_08310, partial [Robiginitomaculum sp.]|nr:hypothetical protein [Robiginitomaculum sp.]